MPARDSPGRETLAHRQEVTSMSTPESAVAILERAQEILDEGGPRAEARFFELVSKAADLGSAEAMMELACCYRDGTGVKRDAKLAFTWMERAAEAGSEGARLNMVHFHEMGIGTKKDLAKATEWQARLKR
jgi:TPR repeat protein